jgi:hypothetical protein
VALQGCPAYKALTYKSDRNLGKDIGANSWMEGATQITGEQKCSPILFWSQSYNLPIYTVVPIHFLYIIIKIFFGKQFFRHLYLYFDYFNYLG